LPFCDLFFFFALKQIGRTVLLLWVFWRRMLAASASRNAPQSQFFPSATSHWAQWVLPSSRSARGGTPSDAETSPHWACQFIALVRVSSHVIASGRAVDPYVLSSGLFDRSEDDWGRAGAARKALGAEAERAYDSVLRWVLRSHFSQNDGVDLACTVPEFPDNASYEHFLADFTSALAGRPSTEGQNTAAACPPSSVISSLEDRTVLRYQKGRSHAVDTFCAFLLHAANGPTLLRGLALRHVTAADHQHTPALDAAIDAVRQCLSLKRLEFGRGGLPWHAWCGLTQLHTLRGVHFYSAFYGGGSHVTFRAVVDALPLLRHLEATYSEPADAAVVPTGQYGGLPAALAPPPLDGFEDLVLRLKTLSLTDLHHQTVAHAGPLPSANDAHVEASANGCCSHPTVSCCPRHTPETISTAVGAAALSSSCYMVTASTTLEALVYRLEDNTVVTCDGCGGSDRDESAAVPSGIVPVISMSRLDSAMVMALRRAPALRVLTAPHWLVDAAIAGAGRDNDAHNRGAVDPLDPSAPQRPDRPPTPTVTQPPLWPRLRQLITLCHDEAADGMSDDAPSDDDEDSPAGAFPSGSAEVALSAALRLHAPRIRSAVIKMLFPAPT
jgi:hypothetical protein